MVSKVTVVYDEWAASYMFVCSCRRDTKPLFYCNVKDCPEKEQIIYCIDCTMIDDKHVHKNK